MAAAPRLLRSGLLLAQTVALLLLASRVARLSIANRRLLDAETARQCIDAGARFSVSPARNRSR